MGRGGGGPHCRMTDCSLITSGGGSGGAAVARFMVIADECTDCIRHPVSFLQSFVRTAAAAAARQTRVGSCSRPAPPHVHMQGPARPGPAPAVLSAICHPSTMTSTSTSSCSRLRAVAAAAAAAAVDAVARQLSHHFCSGAIQQIDKRILQMNK